MIRRTALVTALFVTLLSLAPWRAEAAQHGRSQAVKAPEATGDTVNINTAGVKDLMRLEGVGRKVAEKIVEYREQHGLFSKPEEIRRVEGIGSGLWERNRARIVIE
jgi:competence ComEA-like helix-hairpin-helix protein